MAEGDDTHALQVVCDDHERGVSVLERMNQELEEKLARPSRRAMKPADLKLKLHKAQSKLSFLYESMNELHSSGDNALTEFIHNLVSENIAMKKNTCRNNVCIVLISIRDNMQSVTHSNKKLTVTVDTHDMEIMDKG